MTLRQVDYIILLDTGKYAKEENGTESVFDVEKAWSTANRNTAQHAADRIIGARVVQRTISLNPL